MLAGSRPIELGGPLDHRTPALAIEVAVLLAIVVVGLLLRVDGLMLVPRLTDETEEVRLGLRVAQGELPSLVGAKPYIGGLFTLLVAGAFRLLGPSVEAGRVVVLAVGTLTIIPTYLLGRDIGATGSGDATRGRIVGLLAALLLAVSGPHIMSTSRIAYSNSLTPLFTTLTLWLVYRAIAHRSASVLIAGAAAFGLAVQTHVSALSLAPGLVAVIVVGSSAGRVRLGTPCPRWPGPTLLALTGGASLLIVANLVYVNAIHRLAGLDSAGGRVDQYVGADPWTLIGWGERLVALMRAIALAIAGQVSEVSWPVDRLGSPFVAAPVLLALCGLWAMRRRGIWLPLLVTLSVLVAVSLLNGRVEGLVPRVRHYASLLPLGAVLIAEGVASLHAVLQRCWHAAWVGPVYLATAMIFLMAGPVTALRSYETDRLSRPDKNNQAYLDVLSGVAASGSPDERVYLDDELADVRTFSGGQVLDHLTFAFAVVGQEYDIIDVERESLPIGRSGPQSKRLLLAADDIEPAAARYRLEPLPGDPGDGAPLRAFRAFPRDVSDEHRVLSLAR